ncbi:hypothetical protein [Paenibacillus wynnii]|uniref:hypothetical protein n=1 Tax=Paenibacillus wynnii TaxID=268407 RepID=UPI000B051C79
MLKKEWWMSGRVKIHQSSHARYFDQVIFEFKREISRGGIKGKPPEWIFTFTSGG